MRRKAILLAASSKTASAIGSFSDLAAFASFLRSAHGGGWKADEVYQKESASRDEITTAIGAAKVADYCLIFFSGSGEIIKTDLPWSEMQITLASGENMSERDLNSGSPRCAIIFDCSRMTTQQHSERLQDWRFTLPEPSKSSAELRACYDDGLAAAESGLVKAYATPKSRAVIDGRSFTEHLLNECNSWLQNNHGTLHLGDAVQLANQAIIHAGAHHVVEYHGGRRLHDFPLAIKI